MTEDKTRHKGQEKARQRQVNTRLEIRQETREGKARQDVQGKGKGSRSGLNIADKID